MLLLISSIFSNFCVFFLATLSCGTLSRRGFLPLHISALVGFGAYFFAGFSGLGIFSPVVSGLFAILCTSILSCVMGILFIRVRKASAALLSIGIQLLFNQYIRASNWTGGTQGLWRGIPSIPPLGKILISFLLVGIAIFLYKIFSKTSAVKILTVDGDIPLLPKILKIQNVGVAILLSNILTGILASFGGIIEALQLGHISPANFSLQWSILYVGVIVLVGFENVAAVFIGSIIFSLFPEFLRIIGLGNIEASAWRGFLVGGAVFIIMLVQIPRFSATKKNQQYSRIK